MQCASRAFCRATDRRLAAAITSGCSACSTGSAADVRREAQECLDIFAPGGGCVVNPIHNIQADVPVENILALYETARAYSY